MRRRIMMTSRRRTTPKAAPTSRAPLPAERAFVVQLRADADLGRGSVHGRVEHIVSGTAGLFDSVEQLIAWMRDKTSRPST
jgi:hypothetical protein